MTDEQQQPDTPDQEDDLPPSVELIPPPPLPLSEEQEREVRTLVRVAGRNSRERAIENLLRMMMDKLETFAYDMAEAKTTLDDETFWERPDPFVIALVNEARPEDDFEVEVILLTRGQVLQGKVEIEMDGEDRITFFGVRGQTDESLSIPAPITEEEAIAALNPKHVHKPDGMTHRERPAICGECGQQVRWDESITEWIATTGQPVEPCGRCGQMPVYHPGELGAPACQEWMAPVEGEDGQ